jgi:indole-3-glycerol phosphate synthase
MVALADSLGMDCLVESHDEKELKKVLGLKVPLTQDGTDKPKAKGKRTVDFCVGINNRDLRTLATDTSITERLFPLVPKDRVTVVESGLKSYQDILFLKILGVNSVLVGEALLKQSDLTEAVQELMGW